MTCESCESGLCAICEIMQPNDYLTVFIRSSNGDLKKIVIEPKDRDPKMIQIKKLQKQRAADGAAYLFKYGKKPQQTPKIETQHATTKTQTQTQHGLCGLIGEPSKRMITSTEECLLEPVWRKREQEAKRLGL